LILKNLFVSIALLFFLSVNAQEKCATDIYHKANSGRIDLQREQNLKRMRQLLSRRTEVDGVITIPVVVHVIHSSKDNIIGEYGNISDEQIMSQFPVLNEDYRRKAGTNGFNDNPVGADVEIEFCLAITDPNCLPTNGITRHYSTKTSFFPLNNDDNAMVKAFVDWPNTEYLNIWVCSLSGGYLGYSQFPNYSGLEGVNDYNGPASDDGMLISHKVFGNQTGTATKGIYKLGRTVTHEIGHWLGLKHTWGDDFCGDDYCDDTPQCSGYYIGSDCNHPPSSTCVDGITTKNMIENYLDYTADACMNIFTQNQKARMRSVLSKSPDRIQILSSKGCQSNSSVQLPITLDFENQSMPTDLWEATPSLNANWQYFSNGAFGTSQSSVKTVNNTSNSGQMNLLTISPFIDLEGAGQPAIKFDIAYPNIEQTDSLVISGYTGCNSEPVFIKSYYGNDLITSEINDPAFLPQKKDWKTFFINLNMLSDHRFIKIQFENHSKGGGNIYLDNIKVYKSSKDLSAKFINNLVYLSTNTNYDENTSGLKMKVLFEETSDVYFEIFDLTGQFVTSRLFTNSSPGDFFIDNLSLTSGLYLVKTTVNGQVSVNKVVVMRR
jgi:hypothetical protein